MKNAFFSQKHLARLLFAGGAFVASCKASTAPVPDVSVAVDSSVYHLRPTVGPWYEITLTATISNRGPGSIYLMQSCPSYSLTRPHDYPHGLEFGQVACLAVGGVGLSTITLAAGETHTQTFKLGGSVQNRSNPPITMDDLIGPAVFGFEVSTNLRTFSPRYSEPFELRPPT